MGYRVFLLGDEKFPFVARRFWCGREGIRPNSISKKKRLVFLLVLICHRLHEHDFCANIFCNLLYLEFPEMSCLNLELPAGYGNDAILGRLYAFSDFLAFTHIDLHGLFLHATIESEAHEPFRCGTL